MNQGLKLSIYTANFAIKNCPAFSEFLKTHKYPRRAVKTAEDFFNLPVMDKKNFIHHYSLKKMLGNQKIPALSYASSGSSGKPTFWFRNMEQEAMGGKVHEQIFRDIFKFSKKERVLAVICFSMGVWVAGNYTAASCRWLADSAGYNITTITPGIEAEDILGILKNLSAEYDSVVLAGYPSFVMDILVQTKKRGVKLPKKTKIITAGDSFTEGWRKQAMSFIGTKNPSDIVSVYGSADATVMGFETPLSVFIRQQAGENAEFCEAVFRDSGKDSALFQYDPNHIFFESLNGELLLTTPTTVPLVRYNIKDLGHTIEFEEMKALLEKFGLLKKAQKFLQFSMPFIVKKGRADVAVTFYALNIYPEHIQAGIKRPQFSNILSGNFYAYSKKTKNHSREELILEIELSKQAHGSDSLVKHVTQSVKEQLLALNMEYRRLFASLGDRALPKVKLTNSLSLPKNLKYKALAQINGKKAKIVI